MQEQILPPGASTSSSSPDRTLRLLRNVSNLAFRAAAPAVGAKDGASCTKVEFGPLLQGIEVVAPGAERERLILHFHGGGHCMGTVWWTREMIGRLSKATRSRVISVDYRLAPENPFPAGLEDALTAWRWVCQNYPGAKVAFLGDSAGGNLAFALMVKLAQLKEQQPMACVTLSPWLRLHKPENQPEASPKSPARGLTCGCLSGCMPASRQSKEVTSPPKKLNAWEKGELACMERYCQGHPATDPLVSPVLASEDLARLFPPVLIHAAESEALAEEAKEMAALCRRCGVPVDLELFPSSLHVFQSLGPLKNTKASLQKIDQFLEKWWKADEGL